MARTADFIHGFYGVVDAPDADLVRALVCGGACAIQLRMKSASSREIYSAARDVREILSRYRRPGADRVRLIVNDRLDVALAADADGVHLGQEDLPLASALELIGDRSDFVVGISTHSRAQVEAAARGGAHYLGYGPVFSTSTKANPDPVQGTDRLLTAVRCAGAVPVVAIGGITPARAAEIAATGAAAACAIGAVNGALADGGSGQSADCERAARAINTAFQTAGARG